MNKLLKDDRSVLLADQSLVSGTNFITGILLARMLGPENFGRYAFVWLVLMIILSFQYSFFTQPMQILFYREKESQRKKYLNGVFYCAVCWITLVTLVFVVILFFSATTAHDSKLILYSAITFFFVCLQDFLRRSFILTGRITEALKTDMISVIPQLAVVGIIFFYPVSVADAILFVGVTFVLPVLYAISKYKPGKPFMRNLFSAERDHWRQAKWLLATSALQVFTGNYFLLQAPAYLGVAALGVIRLAQNLIGILNVLLQAFDNYVPASAAKLASAGKNFRKYLVQISLQTGSAFALLLGLLFIFSANVLSAAGGAYKGYSYVLRGFCVIYFVMFITYPLRIYLRLKEKSHHIFIAYIIASLFTLLASGPVIRAFAINGVLAGLFAVQCIMVIYMTSVSVIKKNLYADHSLHPWKG